MTELVLVKVGKEFLVRKWKLDNGDALIMPQNFCTYLVSNSKWIQVFHRGNTTKFKLECFRSNLNTFNWTRTLSIELERFQFNSNAFDRTRLLSIELEYFQSNLNALNRIRMLFIELERFQSNSNAFNRTLSIYIECPQNWQFLPLCTWNLVFTLSSKLLP